MSALSPVLEQLRLTGELVTNVTHWRVAEARSAVYGEWPTALDPRLGAMLARQGIEHLFVHQSAAVQHALQGRNVIVVTPTASGKTLCYNLPALNALLHDPDACALYLFPTKALAHDQLHILEANARALGLAAGAVAAYDGDTPSSARAPIRRAARILLSNPDMLHLGILPYHTQWRAFFTHLRYIVIDELHHYRGIFGSHVANVLRRVWRICRFYGSQPQIIACSATIANPLELAEKLAGQSFELVAHNGAPRGERNLVFYNPPVVNRELGLRRPLLLEARLLAGLLLDHDVQTVVFARSRQAVELLLTYLRQDAERLGRDPAALRGYRAGYLSTERRQIEEGLRQGSLRAVVATNALELGIDIGGLEACLLVGYPGSIASTWQQAGRAGRGSNASAAVLIAGPSPLDQYIVAHPDYFFGQSPEHALINPDNLHVLLSHVQCAVFELPFVQGERFGDEDLGEILGYLESQGLVHQARGAWHWASEGYPAQQVSLRTADPQGVMIEEAEQDPAERQGVRTIGQLDRSSAPLWLYEGAIYLHDGQQYLVEALDWEAGRARVRAVAVDYYTEASRSIRITIEHVNEEQQYEQVHLARGEVLCTSRVSGYRRLRLGSLENLGWGRINLPEQQWHTEACWIMVPDAVVNHLRDEGWWVGEHIGSRGPDWPQQRDRARARDNYRCRWCDAAERPEQQHAVHHIVPFRDFKWLPGQNENYRHANQLENLITLCSACHRLAEQRVAVQSTIAGLARVLGHIVPLFLMCAAQDVGVLSDVQAPQTRVPTIFILDNIPAGTGLSSAVFSMYNTLLGHAAELVRDCSCTAGCPSCIGPTDETHARAKKQVLRLAESLMFMQR